MVGVALDAEHLIALDCYLDAAVGDANSTERLVGRDVLGGGCLDHVTLTPAQVRRPRAAQLTLARETGRAGVRAMADIFDAVARE